ncbi:MAG TPA: phytanoyl-CoA dioxygenase family protein [Acidimicrobiia bacterium]|nr:phytanoyl-CoA dioxygenase family protein [Acidimicrobiia bacterium]
MAIDVRSRVDGPRSDFDAARFFDDELPARIDEHAAAIVPALAFIRPRPLVVDVEGESWTLDADDGRVVIARGARAGASARVKLPAEQLADLADDQQTFMSLWASGALDQQAGTVGHLLDWWLVMRAALDGTPIYTPGSIALDDRNGHPLDLTRTFRADDDDDPDEMRHFLETAGFLHIEGLFSADEMAAVSADMDRAAPTYAQGDGRSWWARTGEGETRLVRMQGFDHESEGARAITEDARFLDLASIPGAGHRFGNKRAHNKIEALFKPIGVTEGISDIPWHKDCGIGRHSYDCCGLTVGISVTGADAVSGQLWVIAGSHRALVWSGIRQPELDLPEIALPTRTGDVTLHLSCTMHMAQPPAERERRVMYSGFALPPLASADASAVAAGRARIGAVREGAPLTVLDRHFKS